MIRKIKLPLKFKLMGLISALLGGSLIYYVYLAVDLYRQDKTAVVYSHTLAQLSGLSDSIRSWLMSERDFVVEILTNKNLSVEEKKKMLALRPVLQEVLSLNESGQEIFLQKNPSSRFLANDGSPLEKLQQLQRGLDLQGLGQISINSELLVHWLIPLNATESLALAISGQELNVLFKRLKGKSDEKVALIDGEGKLVYGDWKDGELFFDTGGDQFGLSQQMSGKVVERINPQGEKTLLAVRSVSGLPLYLFKEVLASQVFAAGELLIKRSLFYGLFILSGAFILGILFSRGLTKNLAHLSLATEWISQGIFNRKVVLSGNDEIAALSDSFNLMGDKIEHLLGEVKEKARLENEVAVAKLVQSYFFPQENLNLNPWQLSGSFYPASECGGDWWGMAELGHKTLIIIADATGHGVPAALLTATAHSALTVPIELVRKKGVALEARQFMELLNVAICSVGANIHMTCWLGILDRQTGELTYSNASHCPPFYFVQNKQELTVLMEGQGPRLGEHRDSQFSQSSVALADGDTITLITDGLTELQNSEAKAWGGRRLRKLLESAQNFPAQMLKMKILKEAFSHANGATLGDDITLVVLKKTTVAPAILPVEQLKSALASATFPIVCGDLRITQLPDHGDIVVAPAGLTHDQVISQLKSTGLNHIVGHSNLLEQELLQTLYALQNNDFLSHLTRYDELIWSKKLKLQNYQEIYRKVDEALAEIPLDEFFESPLPYLKQMAVELLMNATSYSKNSIVEMELGLSESGIYLTVRDNFGHLNRQQVIEKLERAEREKAPLENHDEKPAEKQSHGAGLGLYLTFCCCNRFQVVSVPNVRTEITCMIDKNKRYKNFKGRTPSFHYFELV